MTAMYVMLDHVDLHRDIAGRLQLTNIGTMRAGGSSAKRGSLAAHSTCSHSAWLKA